MWSAASMSNLLKSSITLKALPVLGFSQSAASMPSGL